MFKNVVSASKEKLEPEKKDFLVRSKWTLGFENGDSLAFFVEHRPEGKLPQHKGLRFADTLKNPKSPLASAMSRYASGAAGIVKKAIDTQGRLWALKIFHQMTSSANLSKVRTQDLVNMAQQEVFAWQTLGGDACYFVLEPTKDVPASRIYLVIPWLNGHELFSYVKEQPEHSLTLEICQAVFRDVIQQLQQLKQVNFLHSDVKFENIFFDEATKKATLLDFSLCAINTSPTTLTESYLSPNYMERLNEALHHPPKEKNRAPFPTYSEIDVLYALGKLAALMYQYGFRDVQEKNRSKIFLAMIASYGKSAIVVRGSFEGLAENIETHLKHERRKAKKDALLPLVPSGASLDSTSNPTSPDQRGDTLTTESSADRKRPQTGTSPMEESAEKDIALEMSPSFGH